MNTKQRRNMFIVTVLYTILILYFIFLGFGRVGSIERMTGYTFNFIPDSVPLKFPTLNGITNYPMIWLFNFGNLAAFIPFGILIPLLYRVNFMWFISIFVVSILIIETIQALTLLGSFDINDVIVNSLGAAIGYGSYKVGFKAKGLWRKWIITALTASILSVGVMACSELVDSLLSKREGPVHALNELREGNGNTSMFRNIHSFEVGGETIKPQFNLYDRDHEKIKKYTYILNDKEIILNGYFGVPDHVKNYRGSIRISIDGREVLDFSVDPDYKEVIPIDVVSDKVNNLTITIEGNARLWDVTYKEMKYRWE